jgi:glutathione S-transferase
MSDLEILGFPQSNFVWMARIACAEKGVPVTLTPLRPHAPEVDAIHPYGKIPALRHGDFTVCETRAICAYVDRAFPGPSLIPSDPKLAAKVEEWLSLVLTVIDRAIIRDYLICYMFPDTPDGKPDRARIDAALPAMTKALDVIEKGCASGHLVGDSFTLADAFVTPILYYAGKGPESGVKVKGSPALSAYLAKMLDHPSVRDTIPPPFPTKD